MDRDQFSGVTTGKTAETVVLPRFSDTGTMAILVVEGRDTKLERFLAKNQV